MKPIDCKSLIEKYRAKENTEEYGKGTPYAVLQYLFLTSLERPIEGGLMALPEMQKAESNIEQAWRRAEAGELKIDEFKEALSRWEETARKAIYHMRN